MTHAEEAKGVTMNKITTFDEHDIKTRLQLLYFSQLNCDNVVTNNFCIMDPVTTQICSKKTWLMK